MVVQDYSTLMAFVVVEVYGTFSSAFVWALIGDIERRDVAYVADPMAAAASMVVSDI